MYPSVVDFSMWTRDAVNQTLYRRPAGKNKVTRNMEQNHTFTRETKIFFKIKFV